MAKLAFSFLMSSERSGSNLLTRMIGAHPRVCAPSPTHLFRILAMNLHRYGDLHQGDEWEALVSDAAELFEAKIGSWRSQMSVQGLKEALRSRTLGALLAEIYGSEAESQQREMVFIKENQSHEFFGFLESAFPRSKYLYLVRDPRDMALSWKQAATLRGGVVRAARTWKQDQRGFQRMAAWLNEERRVLPVRYEALVSDTEAVLEAVCSFLGIPFSDRMMRFFGEDAVRKDAASVTDWTNIGKPVMRENFGKYQDGLSDDELCYVEALCQEEMRALGYLPRRYDGRLALGELERHLEAQEPLEKDAYLMVSDAERNRRAAWNVIYNRIISRAVPPL